MGIYDKIEEIRQKPEHIRMRYVWLMVAISMTFVLAVWFLSFGNGRNESTLLPSPGVNSDVVDQFNAQKDSLKNAAQGLTNSMSQLDGDTTENDQQNLNNSQQ